jgi:heme A synthase
MRLALISADKTAVALYDEARFEASIIYLHRMFGAMLMFVLLWLLVLFSLVRPGRANAPRLVC